MYLNVLPPVPMDPASSFRFADLDETALRPAYELLPMNLTPEEIRAMVFEVLG